MEFVILDLEWNPAYSARRKGFINEIIEFGAVKFNTQLNLLDTFSMMVKPQVGKRLNSKVKSLTRISRAELSAGFTFLHAAKKFTQWMGKDSVMMTWGTSDLLALLDNYRYFAKKPAIPFLSRYVDLQRYIQERLGLPLSRQLGLLPAAEVLGIDLENTEHHRALDDSLLSYRCLQRRFDEAVLLDVVQRVDKEFYRKLTFKSVILCNLDNPLVDRSQMFFDCESCGGRARRESEWELRNKTFRARFYCPDCDHPFSGRVQFRLKYEGVQVRKRIFEIPDEEEEVKNMEKTEDAEDIS